MPDVGSVGIFWKYSPLLCGTNLCFCTWDATMAFGNNEAARARSFTSRSTSGISMLEVVITVLGHPVYTTCILANLVKPVVYVNVFV